MYTFRQLIEVEVNNLKSEKRVVLEVIDMCKNFGVTVALNHVSFQVCSGEIRGLVGENGSGKSTVSSIISGMQPATSGSMKFKGELWNPKDMLYAMEKGIGMIVQEAGTIENISIAENIFLGHEKIFKKGLRIQKSAMIQAAKKILQEIGLTDINPARPTRILDFQDRKLIEIARVMYWKPEILIVDETTTALSQRGRKILYDIMQKLALEGKSVLLISHDLEELMEQCTTLSVLRDGVMIGDLEEKEFESRKIKQMMVGREVSDSYYRTDFDPYEEEVVLKANYITTLKDLLCFSLELHKGEILGIGGLSHCGMHTLGKALFGLEKVVDGEVVLPKGDTIVKNSKIAVKNGMAYLSKNRDTESLGLSATIRENIASTGYSKNTLLGPIISFQKEKNYVAEQIGQLNIKCASPYHDVDTLSGGNKQKVVFGKWLASEADILILDCPTRGVDIGVKAAMYQLIYELKKNGKSIILISEELPELVGMSDRIIIMKDGKISGEFMRNENINEHQIIEHML